MEIESARGRAGELGERESVCRDHGLIMGRNALHRDGGRYSRSRLPLLLLDEGIIGYQLAGHGHGQSQSPACGWTQPPTTHQPCLHGGWMERILIERGLLSPIDRQARPGLLRLSIPGTGLRGANQRWSGWFCFLLPASCFLRLRESRRACILVSMV